ncbi:replication initiator protein A, partial [Streptococcus agalactiae]|nr:replication initiator protein A [Streptococcus agalactiae]
MAYLSKLSDLDPSLMDADSEQIYIPKVLFEHNDFKGLTY